MNKLEIQRIAREARPDLDSYRNCGAINTEIYNALQQQNVDCELVEGRLTRYELRGHGPEHAFVIVTDERVTTTPIIVDGAVDQFVTENQKDGKVFFALGSQKEVPKVGVFSAKDEFYDNYVW